MSPATVVATNQASDRISELARDIFAAVSSFSGMELEVGEATNKLKEATDARQTGRAGILLACAHVSISHSMTADEIKRAKPHVAKMNNNIETQKALETFLADCALAMDPAVRDHAVDLHAVVHEAWEIEAGADKADPKPLRKAFKREYHAFKRAMGRARDEGIVMGGVTAVADWAKMEDPDFDVGKVSKSIKSLRDQIAAIHPNFPVDALRSAVEFLSEVTEDALKAARQGLIEAQNDVTESHTLAPVPQVVKQRVAAAAAPVVAAPPAEIEIPDIDAMLDNLSLAAA